MSRTTRCANPQVAVTANREKRILRRTNCKSWLGISPAWHSPRSEMERENILQRHRQRQPTYLDSSAATVQLLLNSHRAPCKKCSHVIQFSFQSIPSMFSSHAHETRQASVVRAHIRNASDKSRRHPVHDERLFAYFHVERLSRRNQTST